MPWTESLGEPRLALALKSGNFGGATSSRRRSGCLRERRRRSRDRIAKFGRSIFDRGLTAGSTGNISVKVDDGFLMTPTGASLGELDPARLSKLGFDGTHHRRRPADQGIVPAYRDVRGTAARAGAVVHLHSTHSAAVSCMADLDPKNILPPLTAYYVMRVGRLPLVPYFAPGDLKLAKAVKALASSTMR